MLDDKDLKKQILESTNDDQIPNFSTAIKQKYQSRQERKKPWYKKGLVWGLGTPILACGIIAAIMIPNMMKPNESEPTTPTFGPHIVGKRNEIAFGVLSANNILPDMDSGVSIKPKLAKQISQSDFEKQMNYLNPYMKTAESMLGSNLDLNPIMVESTDVNYQYLMEIISPEGTLQFFYNELDENVTPLKSSEDDEDEHDDEVEEEDEQDDEQDGEGEDDEEQEYSLEGIFKKNDLTYYVSGEKEIEAGEFELNLNVYEDEDKTIKLISIEQEIENEGNEKEQSYTYSTFKDNVLDFKAKVSFEDEDNELEMEVEINADNKTSTYLINKVDTTNFDLDYTYDGTNGLIKTSVVEETVENVTTSYYKYVEDAQKFTVSLKRS